MYKQVPFEFEPGQVEAFAVHLGITDHEQVEALCQRLCVIASRYRRWREQDKDKSIPTRAEQNAALWEIGFRRTAWQALHPEIQFLLHLAVVKLGKGQLEPCEYGGSFDWAFADPVRLRKVVEIARRLNERSGPRVRLSFGLLAFQLAKLYEEFTGKAFTHTAHKGRLYTGRSQSKSGIFVDKVMQAIDKDITSSQRTTASRYAAQTQKSRRPRKH